MTDAFIPTAGSGHGLMRRSSGRLDWASLRALLQHRRLGVARPASATTARLQPDPAPRLASPDGRAPRARSQAALQLQDAYAASTLKIVRQADALDPSETALDVGPVAVRALVEAVLLDLEPLAREAGLALLRDGGVGGDGVCCGDPGELRGVLRHLVLRALTFEQAPGHLRVAVAFTGYEVRILILSRSPEAKLATRSDVYRDDLIAPQRLVQAMGGSLVLEPRRAGYLPLCLALPALSDLHAV